MFTKGYDKLSIIQILAELANFSALEGASALEELKRRLGFEVNPQLVVCPQRSEFTSAVRAGRAFGELCSIPAVVGQLSRFQFWNDSNTPQGQPTNVLPILVKVGAGIAMNCTLTLDNAQSGGFTEASTGGNADGMINLFSGDIGDANGDDHRSQMGASALAGPGFDNAGLGAIPASPAAHRLISARLAAGIEVDVMAGSGITLPWIRPGRGFSIFGGAVNTAFQVTILWMEVPIS